MAYWTIEEVADFLDITVAQVYESRRRKEYPGALGKMQGRRLRFNSEKVEAGPESAESTEDVQTAILWTLQGIEAKLGKILAELVAQRPQYFNLVTTETVETTIEIEGDEEE